MIHRIRRLSQLWDIDERACVVVRFYCLLEYITDVYINLYFYRAACTWHQFEIVFSISVHLLIIKNLLRYLYSNNYRDIFLSFPSKTGSKLADTLKTVHRETVTIFHNKRSEL